MVLYRATANLKRDGFPILEVLENGEWRKFEETVNSETFKGLHRLWGEEIDPDDPDIFTVYYIEKEVNEALKGASALLKEAFGTLMSVT